VFIVSGFWHGANWTFIVWGALNAAYFLPLLLTNRNRINLDTVAEGRYFPTLREFGGMVLTYGLTVLAWVFFRAESISHAFEYLGTIFSPSLFAPIEVMPNKKVFVFIAAFFALEWFGREQQYAIANFGVKWNRAIRYAVYYAFMLIILYYSGKEQEFIYFQF
jgi:D-alanyl-lipoteichoic acid acyltransferase DltB (MBOAT superfamily)